MLRWLLPGLPAIACLHLIACDDGACTLIGCEHRAQVTLPAGSVTGPYDLFVTDGLQMLAARCNDPDPEQTQENPPELVCDQGGFEIEGHPLANVRSFRITVIDVETDEPRVEHAEVFLDVVQTLTPNGERCEPTCFVRHGSVLQHGL